MPACAETNRSVQELTGIQYNLGEKNKEMTKGRQRHDMKDTLVILTVLADRNRFAPNPNLTNIMNSINASSDVDFDCARASGEN